MENNHTFVTYLDNKKQMRNFDRNDKSHSGTKSSFNREDSSYSNNTSNSESVMQFRKDKRKRTSSVEKVSREAKSAHKPDHARERSAGAEPAKRNSYNPNFTKDNKRVGGNNSDRPRLGSDKPKFRQDKPKFGEDKPKWSPKPDRSTGGKEHFGGVKKSFNKDRNSSDKRYDSTNYPKFEAPKLDRPLRLNRFLAMSGLCSRREADDYISAGVVTVNGEVVTELGSKISPTDVVKFNDSIVQGEKKVYIVMNKPKGFVTTIEDPHADKTVMDIVKSACQERVYPVGRLDKNSVGVLLITNDGDLTRELTHPSYMKKKIYQVALDKPLTKADMERITEGVMLEDGPIHADQISYVGDSRKDVGIEIHSGRNRIIRRIFDTLGYKVQKLDRVYFAGLTKKSLKRGSWRYLTPKEVSILKSGSYE